MSDRATPQQRLVRSVALGALAALAIASPAAAHVTAQPPELPPGGFVKLTFRAPNERDVPTMRLAVQLPPELDSVKVQPVKGWNYKITRTKLPEPRELFGEKVTEYVSKIEWSGGRIGVDEFQEFPVSMKLPDKGNFGDYMTFPAIQTYQGGEVVRWIQKPESPDGDWDELETPAAHVQLAAADAEAAAPAASATTQATGTGGQSDDGGSDVLAIVALVVAAIALALGATATLRRTRTA